MNKQLYIFIGMEVILLAIAAATIILKYQMLSQLILIGTPFLLICLLAYQHVYSGVKTPHRILISIMMYAVIAVNLYGVLNPELEWTGVMSSPVFGDGGQNFTSEGYEIHGNNDGGVSSLIYIIMIFGTASLILLYEFILSLKYIMNKLRT